MAELKIQFLDVGQGDGIFIEFPGGATMLVDLGSTKNKGTVNPDILTYFRTKTKYGMAGETLDYLVLTHGDLDHYNMVQVFLENLQVNVARLMYSGIPSNYKVFKTQEATRARSKANNLIERIKELCPNVQEIKPTGYFPTPLYHQNFGGAQVHLLAANTPGTLKQDEAWRKNTGSIVLMLAYGKVRIILAGDATSDTERSIRGSYHLTPSALSSHVLKVGHHGSRRTSNTVQWIKAVSPAFVFITADRHGSLDDDTATGHRLPQTLTLDLIGKHSKHLFQQCEAHNVISAYDADDYKSYNKTPDEPNDNVTIPVQENQWLSTVTKAGVFTSLVAMDVKQQTGPVADQGAQYQLSISDQSVIDITSTWEPSHLVSMQLT